MDKGCGTGVGVGTGVVVEVDVGKVVGEAVGDCVAVGLGVGSGGGAVHALNWSRASKWIAVILIRVFGFIDLLPVNFSEVIS
jgi:hypothetical protein